MNKIRTILGWTLVLTSVIGTTLAFTDEYQTHGIALAISSAVAAYLVTNSK